MTHMSDIQNLLRYIGDADLKYYEFDIFGLRPTPADHAVEAPDPAPQAAVPAEPLKQDERPAGASRIGLRPVETAEAEEDPVQDVAIWLSLRGASAHEALSDDGVIAPSQNPMDMRDYGQKSARIRVRPSLAALYTPPPDAEGGDENGDIALSEFFKKL